MKIPLYLALTSAEFAKCKAIPEKIGWMACHFSPYCTGLSNVPTSLPAGSLLIINDITPIHGHNPQRISDTVAATVKSLQCAGVLLDFQRQGYEESKQLACHLTKLPFPVAVSALYGNSLDCPIFIPAPPLRTPLSEYLAPFQGREIWLEASVADETVSVTPEGSRVVPIDPAGNYPHEDTELHCHYRIGIQAKQAQFHLRRTETDLQALINAAADLGVTRAVGLYQELKEFPLFNRSGL